MRFCFIITDCWRQTIFKCCLFFAQRICIREEHVCLLHRHPAPKVLAHYRWRQQNTLDPQSRRLDSTLLGWPNFPRTTFPKEIFAYYDSSKDKLTMDVFTLVFIVWGIGIIAALTTVIIENQIFKHKWLYDLRHSAWLKFYWHIVLRYDQIKWSLLLHKACNNELNVQKFVEFYITFLTI